MSFEGMILGIIITLVVLWGLWTTIVITQQQTARVVETFGKYSSTRTAGLSFKAPWPIQSASGPISLQIKEASVNVGVKAKDNAFLKIPIKAQFSVNPRSVKDAHYKLANPEEQIESYLVNQVRSSASSKDFDELYASQDSIEIEVKQVLAQRMADFGYIIENVLVDDPQPSEELRDAFDKVLASKRLLEAAENEGAAKKVMLVAGAKAEAEALELRGAALVKFRTVITEGNAEAIAAFIKDTDMTSHDALKFILNINEMEAITNVGQSGGHVVYISAAARDAGANVNSAMIQSIPIQDNSAQKKANTVAPSAHHPARTA